MAELRKVKLRDAVAIAGVHQDAGAVVEVELGLAIRLVNSGRAEPVDAKGKKLPPGAEGKQTTAQGLTAGGAGAPLVRS